MLASKERDKSYEFMVIEKREFSTIHENTIWFVHTRTLQFTTHLMFRCVMQAGPHWSKNFTSSLFPDDSLQQTRFILQEKGISEKIIH